MTKAREIAELGQKLTVDASGNINVAGNVTSDGLDVDGDVTLDPTSNFVTITGGTNDNNASGITLRPNWGNTSGGKLANELRFQAADNNTTNAYDTFATIQGLTSDWTSDSNIGGRLIFNVKYNNASKNALDLRETESVFNNGSNDRDFRVESNNNAYMLFVDGGADKVNIGNASGTYDLNVRKTNSGGDVGFQVSNRDTSQTSGSRALIALQADVDNDGSLEEFLHIRGGTNTSSFAEFVGREGTSLRFQGDAGTSSVFNDSSVDMDFRVESSNNAYMLFVDGGNDRVGIANSTPDATLHVGSINPQSNAKVVVRENGNCIEWGHGNTSYGYYGILGTNKNNGHAFIGFGAKANSGTSNTHDTTGHQGTVLRQNISGVFIVEQSTNADADDQSFNERVRMSSSEVAFNEESTDTDFRVESNTNTHALFVDAGNNGVGIRTSSVDHPLEVLTSDNDKGIVLKDNDNDLVIIQRENEQFGRIRLMDSSSTRIDISARGDQGFKVYSTPSTFNESGGDNDFRVESDGQTHALFVDAGSDQIGVFQSSPKDQSAMEVLVAETSSIAEKSDQTDYADRGAFTIKRDSNSYSHALIMCGNDNIGSAIEQGRVNAGSTWETYMRFYNHSTATGGNTSLTELTPVMEMDSNYLRMSSGTNGIQFNGDTATDNALNDYEKGTWSPSYRNGDTQMTYTMGNERAEYRKIGDTVWIHLGFRFTALSGTSTGAFRIYGLPYAAKSNGAYQEYRFSCALGNNPTTANSDRVFGFSSNGNQYLEFRIMNGGDSVFQTNQLDGDTFMSVWGFYVVA